MSIRVYPIRMTRKQWYIGLYTIHECTRGCNYILVKDRKTKKYKCNIDTTHSQYNSEMNSGSGSNSDEETVHHCHRKNKIENTIISVNNFDIRNPRGLFGKLHMADQIVIPDNEFTMVLDFPFCTKLKITVNEPLGDGFTLKEVLYAIKLSYQDIYETEEETATQYTYLLMKECSKCNSINIKNRLQQDNIQDDSDNLIDMECSICQETIDNKTDIIKLNKCSHIFHKSCMYEWVDAKGKTCPLCRSVLYMCDKCDGAGYTTIYHEGVVPPIEYRGIERRHRTDGIYGIYDYYLEDLYINSLSYNNEWKKLHVSLQT